MIISIHRRSLRAYNYLREPWNTDSSVLVPEIPKRRWEGEGCSDFLDLLPCFDV
jgi:hypothetical protein